MHQGSKEHLPSAGEKYISLHEHHGSEGHLSSEDEKQLPAVGKHLPVNEHHRYNTNEHNALELKKLLSAGEHLELKKYLLSNELLNLDEALIGEYDVLERSYTFS